MMLHVGAYAKVKLPYVEEIVYVYGCPEHGVRSRGHYCELCGKKLFEIEKTVEKHPGFYTLFNYSDEVKGRLSFAFRDDGYSYYVADDKNDGTSFDFDSECRLTLPSMSVALLTFEEKYPYELGKLKEKGTDFSINFGVLNWYY